LQIVQYNTLAIECSDAVNENDFWFVFHLRRRKCVIPKNVTRVISA
jgi:hypothetical protein